MAQDRLTANAKAGGCASKLSPALLDQVLNCVPRITNEHVLVGNETADDAGIYRLSDDLALVQTVDFFTPIVDDPFTFGAIAAANALSDIYAMGGRPLSALSVVAYPAKLGKDTLREILTGGAEKMREAGCAILGGHSVNDEEIKFGYAVTGSVHPGRYWPNAGARAGDTLVFTKRLGTGVISTALKRGAAAAGHVDAAIAQMLTLNRAAAEALEDCGVHGCTDVTGFSLLGHAREMALASGVTLEIHGACLRLLDGALDYARQGILPGGLHNNRAFASPDVALEGEFEPALADLLYDPQTSGGLLVALPDAGARRFLDRCEFAYTIGRVTARAAKPVRIL